MVSCDGELLSARANERFVGGRAPVVEMMSGLDLVQTLYEKTERACSMRSYEELDRRTILDELLRRLLIHESLTESNKEGG